MDALFKQKLLSLRNPLEPKTFGEALLPNALWVSKKPIKVEAAPIAKEVYSEKVQVIESLERFAEEQSSQLKSDILKVEGGEIQIRKNAEWDDLETYSTVEALKTQLMLNSQLAEVQLKDKDQKAVKVIFVTEAFRSWEEVEPELQTGFINELLTGFPLKTAEFFERMIKGMKLAPEEVIIYPVEGSDSIDLAAEVMKVAAFYRPEVIITLGAKATQKILKSNDRLSMIHGQFFNRRVGEGENFQIVPLFHPAIIETNLNMKKTAWADMQKIMKHLKKLP